jgi:hypothetical protein
MMDYGKPASKKVKDCEWWLPAVSSPKGPVPLLSGKRQDSPAKAKAEARRVLALMLLPAPERRLG